MWIDKYFWIFSIISLFVTFVVESVDDPAASADLQSLRKRWGASEIVRDLNHIKEDLKKISELQDTGDLSTSEALFYFLRMHDFDNNGKLDGHELIAAMHHSFEHNQNSGNSDPVQLDEIVGIVDSFFAYDDNHDGFISYEELRNHLGNDNDKNT